MTKLMAKLINHDNKPVGAVEVDDLKRKPGEAYARRSVIRMGVKYSEPEAEALDFIRPDEWHEEVIA
jgi:hypothetical protein